MIASLALVGFLATQPASNASRVLEVPRLGLEVLNPGVVGRKLIHLDDTIGPTARSVGPHAKAKGLLVYATSPECDACSADLDALDAVAEKTRALGGLVVVVVLVDKRDDADAARKAFAGSKHLSVLTLDSHGLARRALELSGPRRALVFRSDGRAVGSYLENPAANAAKKLAEILEEDR
ncbi:MAG: hypothetical protein HYV07_31130 [Deltaproteobacteria bacterium]|nr:hypothetical protein [Deltaproteobacteria bacterium]